MSTSALFVRHIAQVYILLRIMQMMMVTRSYTGSPLLVKTSLSIYCSSMELMLMPSMIASRLPFTQPLSLGRSVWTLCLGRSGLDSWCRMQISVHQCQCLNVCMFMSVYRDNWLLMDMCRCLLYTLYVCTHLCLVMCKCLFIYVLGWRCCLLDLCVYTCLCIGVSLWVSVYRCLCVYVYMSVHRCLHVVICVQTSVCIRVCLLLSVYRCLCLGVCVRIHAQV